MSLMSLMSLQTTQTCYACSCVPTAHTDGLTVTLILTLGARQF